MAEASEAAVASRAEQQEVSLKKPCEDVDGPVSAQDAAEEGVSCASSNGHGPGVDETAAANGETKEGEENAKPAAEGSQESNEPQKEEVARKPEEFVLGVDVGSETSVAALSDSLNHHLPFLVHSPSTSGIVHTVCVAYKGKQRSLGDEAQQQSVMNPANCVYDFKRLIGLTTEEAASRSGKGFKWPLYEVGSAEGGASGAHVQWNEQEFVAPFQAIGGAYLKSVADFARRDAIFWKKNPPLDVKQAVLTVPVCFSAAQRAAMLDCARLADIEVLQVIDDTTAAALYYGVMNDSSMPMPPDPPKQAEEQSGAPEATASAGDDEAAATASGDPAAPGDAVPNGAEEKSDKAVAEQSTDDSEGGATGEQPLDPSYYQHVVIVDMGSRFFSAALVEFKRGSLRVLKRAGAELGGQDMTDALLDHVLQLLSKKYQIEVEKHSRSIARVMKAVTKSKKVLSTIHEAVVEVENIMDRDIQETVSRSQFESLCEPLVARMKDVLSEVMSAAPTCCSFSNLKVEIIGGAVRVPFVQTAIKEACGVETLHVSLDSATAVSSGAALYGVNGLTGTANVAKLPTGQEKYLVHDEAIVELDTLSTFRLDEKVVAAILEREGQIDKENAEVARVGRIRNEIEQYIYSTRDTIRAAPAEEVPEAERDALLKVLKEEEDWVLYSDEAEEANGDQLETRYDALVQRVQSIGVGFTKYSRKLQEEKEKAEREAAEAEKNRVVTHRDKLSKPISNKEKVNAAQKRKEQGTQLFRELDYEHAIVRYKQAIGHAKDLCGEVPDEMAAEVKAIETACCTNLALCYLKLNKPTMARENCTLVLKKDPENAKALYRRALAYDGEKDFEAALVDVSKLVELEPTNRNAVKLKKQLEAKIRKRQENAKKMYKRMGSMFE